MNRAAYLALGANLGDRARALREAIARVRRGGPEPSGCLPRL